MQTAMQNETLQTPPDFSPDHDGDGSENAPQAEQAEAEQAQSEQAETDANVLYNQATLRWLELRLRRLIENKRNETAAKNNALVPVPVSPVGVAAAVTVPAAGGAETGPKMGRSGSAWSFLPVWLPAPRRALLPTAAHLEVAAPVFARVPDPTPTIPTVSDAQIQEAAQERESILRDARELPAAARVAAAFGLSPFERDALLLCAAPELRTGFGTLCAEANATLGLLNTPYPTFALALAAFGDGAGLEIVAPQRPLRYWSLVELLDANAAHRPPIIAAPLRVDERIVNALRGLDYSDARLGTWLRSPEPWPPPLAPESSQAGARDEILWGWNRAAAAAATSTAAGDGVGANGLPVVQLLGADTPAKIRLAAHAAALVGCATYRLPLEELVLSGPDLETTTRLLLREALLSPVAVYLDAHQGLESGSGSGTENSRAAFLRRFLVLAGGRLPLFLGVRDAWERDRRNDLAVEARLPTAFEQRETWANALGPDANDLPGRLAAQFQLDAPEINDLVSASRFEAHQQNKPLTETLWNACRDRVRPRMDAFAHRINAKATLFDLVLPPETFVLIEQIAAQVAQRSRVYTDWGFGGRSERGLGISVLFTGESGTGKTMAAEALANHLQLSLYRIDLSSVVSKYIGETEENLRKVFDAAEEGGVVLFFDEADALFGKRTEVKDSHDRYANIEVNYLLQRMEAYQGLAILATNRKSAVDTAFMRRLRFVITFPMPGVTERKSLWERAFPPDTPVENINTDRLAKLLLSGGNIASVAVNAAFLAADAGEAVTMPLILRAARNEYVKMERSINEADFR